MGQLKLLLVLRLALLLNIGNSAAQQNTIFNQNPYRRTTNFNRPQAFPTTTLPTTALLAQPNYQGYNQYNGRNYVPITSYQNEINYDGSFAYGYSSGDGTTAQAQGYVKNLGQKDLEAQVVQGSYSYTSPEGVPIRVSYIADENGFRAEGAHLPTPPPIPEAIAKSLDYISRVQPYQPYNQNINPNLNPYQTPFQQAQIRSGQLNPFDLQQQQKTIFQQQQQQQQQRQDDSGQYQPQGQEGQYNESNQSNQQRPFGSPTFPQTNTIQQQQTQQQQQQAQQQQLLTQQLQGRPNQIIPNQYGGYNKYRRYKKQAV